MPHSDSKNSLIKSRHLAAFLLGAAVSRLFPDISLFLTKIDSIGFSYEFISNKQIPINENLLELIEQQMIQLSQKIEEIHLFEMMKENGHTYFCHHGQPLRGEVLLELPSNVISLAKLDHFVDIFPYSEIPAIAPFKLMDIEESSLEGEWRLKIYGLLQDSKPSLKELVKKYREFKKYDPSQIAEELRLYVKSESETIWISKGFQFKKNIKSLIFSALLENNFEQVERSSLFFDEAEDFFNPFYLQAKKERKSLPYKFCSILKENFAVEGEDPLTSTFDCEGIYCTPKQLSNELISSLLFFEQIFKIFGFKYRLCLVENYEKQWSNKAEKSRFIAQTGRKSALLESILKSCNLPFEKEKVSFSTPLRSQPFLDFRRVDELGREESMGWLTFFEQQETSVIVRSCCYTIERWIDALLEECRGKLPFWLQTEQVRILTLHETHSINANWLKKRFHKCQVQAFVDLRPLSLSEKVFEAKREKIPFCIILGDQESSWIDEVRVQEEISENNCDNSLIKLSLRALENDKKEVKSLQSFLDECCELNRSKT